MILLVSYDLKGPTKAYGDLFDVLKSQETWWHYLSSTWLVATEEESAHDLFRNLKPFLQAGDRLLVIEVTEEYSGWLPKKAWNWIKANIDD